MGAAWFRRCCALLIAVTLIGCGGGHSRALPPVSRTQPASGPSNLSLQVRIPARSASRHGLRPAYISASTASLAFSLNGASVGTVDTTAQSAQCASDGTGGRLCSGSFSVNPGTYTYTLAAFDQVKGAGAKLSTASGQLVVIVNQANVLHAVLDGIVSGLALSLNPSTVTQGAAATVKVNVSAMDPDGNVILTGAYADSNGNPVSVTLGTSDTTGAMQLSQAALSGATPATLNYTGSRLPTQIVTAKAPNVSAAAATLVVAAPSSVLGNTINTVALLAAPAKASNPTGTWSLTAAVIGADGKPVSGASVSFAATAGTLGGATATTDASGTAITTIAPPSGNGPVIAVTASAGTKSSVVNIQFASQTIPSNLRRKSSTTSTVAMGYVGVPLSAYTSASNPFLAADPCYLPPSSTPSVQCQAALDQQHLILTDLKNVGQFVCTVAQNTMDEIETAQCAGFAIELVSCVAAATGFGMAVCEVALEVDKTSKSITGDFFAQACLNKLIGILAEHYNATFVVNAASFAKTPDVKGGLAVLCDLKSEFITQSPTLLQFTLLPRTFLKTTEGARAEVTAWGSGFNDVDTITFTPSGPASGGPVKWSLYDGTMATAKNARQLVLYNDGQMSLAPPVTHIGDQHGVTTWTLAMTDRTGTLKSQTFTVDYEPPLLQLSKIKEFPAVFGVNWLASGPNGYVWFLEGLDGVGRISTSTGALENFNVVNPHLASFGEGMTLGADGAMWFAEAACSLCEQVIGTVSKDGVITEKRIGVYGASGTGIALGPDGGFWLTESFYLPPGVTGPAGGIFHYVPGGNSMMYNLNPYTVAPAGIVFAPDGALWFAEGGKIGRITTDGAINEFVVGSPDISITGITVGPDDMIWFTEQTANKIGRMSLAGVVLNEWTVTTPNSAPQFITSGRDGALWFSEYGAGQIGRVTTAGVFSEFKTPTSNSGPVGIVTGPDGNIWFAEHIAGALGRISP